MNEKSISFIEIPVSLGKVKANFYSNKYVLMDETSIVNPHDHPEYELHYIVEGENNHVINDVAHHTKAGDLIVLHPSEYHYQLPLDPNGKYLQYSVRFHIKSPADSASPQQKKAYQSLIELLNSISILHDTNLSLLPAFRIFETEITQTQNGYIHCLQAMSSYILTGVIRLAEKVESNSFLSDDVTYIEFGRNRIEMFLHSRYPDSNAKVQHLADLLKLSRRQTSRLMLREYGMNFAAKLNETRIRHAAFQLLNTDKPITQICSDCGFVNYSYFSTCFHKEMGMPPSDYRKKGKKQS